MRARTRFQRELDYAYFAARLGWTPEQYGSLTPVERLFVRKELETLMVERATIATDAVRLGAAGALGGRSYRMFRRRAARDESITDAEVAELRAAFDEHPPWTPWQGVNYG